MVSNQNVLKKSPLISFLRKEKICSSDQNRAKLLISLSVVFFIAAITIYFNTVSIGAISIKDLPEGVFLVDANGQLQQVVNGELKLVNE